ncbi:MAG: hypothetical protein E3J72_16955 [Planctomycetota bacterium]|nr:MAG: hypothetical protein E3J72_16955 [Planctomycetota bacterium]
MKRSHVVICASIILYMLLSGAGYAGQQAPRPEPPKPDPNAKALMLLGRGYWAPDLKKVEKPNVNLTIELPEGWVFGNVTLINQNIISRAQPQQRRAAQTEANRRLAAMYHEKQNCLIHVLYIDNQKDDSPGGLIAQRKSRNPGTKYEEKYYLLQGCGIALLAWDGVASNKAALKQFNAYFAPASGHVLFHLSGVMPKKSFEKMDDLMKEATSKFTFKSKDASAAFKVAKKEEVTEDAAKPLMKELWLVTDKKQAKKKTKKGSSPPWGVKKPKGWQWIDMDSWKGEAKPDTSKLKDRNRALTIENIWRQRVVGIYSSEWDCYVVMRAISAGREVKVQEIFDRNKNDLLGNKNVKVLTTNPKYPMGKVMGARIGFSQEDRRTGRRLAFINYFACKDKNIFIVEVVLPEVKYDEFLKFDKKKKFIRKNFLF